MKKIPIVLFFLLLFGGCTTSLCLVAYVEFFKETVTDAQRRACSGLMFLAFLMGVGAFFLSVLIHDSWDE